MQSILARRRGRIRLRNEEELGGRAGGLKMDFLFLLSGRLWRSGTKKEPCSPQIQRSESA